MYHMHTHITVYSTSHTHNTCTQLTMYVYSHTGWGHLKDILCDAALRTFTRQSDPMWQPCSPPHGHLTGIPCQYSLVLGLGEMVHSVLTNSGRQDCSPPLIVTRWPWIPNSPVFSSHCWDYRPGPPRHFYRSMFRIACAIISISLYLQDVFALILSSQP